MDFSIFVLDFLQQFRILGGGGGGGAALLQVSADRQSGVTQTRTAGDAAFCGDSGAWHHVSMKWRSCRAYFSNRARVIELRVKILKFRPVKCVHMIFCRSPFNHLPNLGEVPYNTQYRYWSTVRSRLWPMLSMWMVIWTGYLWISMFERWLFVSRRKCTHPFWQRKESCVGLDLFDRCECSWRMQGSKVAYALEAGRAYLFFRPIQPPPKSDKKSASQNFRY